MVINGVDNTRAISGCHDCCPVHCPHLGKPDLTCYCIRHAETLSKDDQEQPCL